MNGVSYDTSFPAQYSDLNDDFERACLCRTAKRLIGVKDVIELEAMRDQKLGVDLVRCNSLEQHRYRNGVNQPRRDGDVAVPKVLQMEIDLFPVHADVGNCAAWTDDFFAKLKSGRYAHRFDGGIHSSVCGHLHDHFTSLAIRTIDGCRRSEALGDFQSIIVEIDHDDLGGRIKLCGKKGCKPDRPRTDDGDGISRLNFSIEDAALETCRQDIT